MCVCVFVCLHRANSFKPRKCQIGIAVLFAQFLLLEMLLPFGRSKAYCVVHTGQLSLVFYLG